MSRLEAWMVTAPAATMPVILIGHADEMSAIIRMGERISGRPHEEHGMAADAAWLVLREIARIRPQHLYGLSGIVVPPTTPKLTKSRLAVLRDLDAPEHWLRMTERERMLLAARGVCSCGVRLATIDDGHDPYGRV